jgi:hypothetical protein
MHYQARYAEQLIAEGRTDSDLLPFDDAERGRRVPDPVDVDAGLGADDGCRVGSRGARTHHEGRHGSEVEGRGMHYQARYAEQLIAEGRTDSDLLPFDESVAIMAALDVGRGDAERGRRVPDPVDVDAGLGADDGCRVGSRGARNLGIYPVSFAWDVLGPMTGIRAIGRLGETGADTEVASRRSR